MRQLKIAFAEIGEERSHLERADFELDADLFLLILEAGADQSGLLFGGNFDCEVEALAVGSSEVAGGVEEFSCGRGIVVVGFHVWFVGPVIGREQAGREAGLVADKLFDQGFAVGGIGKGLAKIAFGKDGVFKIRADIGEIRSGALGNAKLGALGENGNHVRRKGTDFDVGGTFAEFEGADDGVWNDAECDSLKFRSAAEIIGILFEDYFVVLGLADEAEGAAAD